MMSLFIAFLIAQGAWLGGLLRLYHEANNSYDRHMMFLEIVVFIIVFMFVDILLLLPRILHAH